MPLLDRFVLGAERFGPAVVFAVLVFQPPQFVGESLNIILQEVHFLFQISDFDVRLVQLILQARVLSPQVVCALICLDVAVVGIFAVSFLRVDFLSQPSDCFVLFSKQVIQSPVLAHHLSVFVLDGDIPVVDLGDPGFVLVLDAGLVFD